MSTVVLVKYGRRISSVVQWLSPKYCVQSSKETLDVVVTTSFEYVHGIPTSLGQIVTDRRSGRSFSIVLEIYDNYNH